MKRHPMKRMSWLFTAGLACTFVGCGGDDGTSMTNAEDATGDGDGDGDGDAGECTIVEIADPIESDTTWTADNCYVLSDLIFVTGAVLTIESGTEIRGLNGSALIIDQDSRLEAVGTVDAPIVFTSNEGNPAPGDWGGLVLLGSATTNIGVGMAEGFPVPPTYGGDDDSHNCGTLQYVRVEYAGFAISEGNELNGITFYACGTGTTVDHVQSHMGLDDGIEWFGGTMDADHLVVTGASDDSLDIDQGFRGTLTHLFVQQNPSVGDNCFEVSNQGINFDALPKTNPQVCNATCIGSGDGGEKSKGLTLKEATHGHWHANIFTNITNEATLLLDDPTATEVTGGNIELANNIFFANLGADEHVSESTTTDTAAWAAWVQDPSRANLGSDPGLASVSWGSPDPTPSGEVAGDGSGCGGTSYIGAVDPTGENWTAAGWINWAP